MAATIAYKINGKADTKALEKTQSGIKKISNQVKTLNTMVGGMIIAKVMQGINKVVNGSTDAFMAQNKAATLANKSFKNNNQLTAKSINNIKNAMNSFSLDNLIDGDTLNNAAALASQMGLNEEQIIKVMDAASEMASAGIMPMDQAVKKLAETYTGSLGELKKLSPELANLTTEQLKAGDAVDAMKKKYDGFRETLAGTFEGRNSQIKNQFSDLQSSVGGIIQALKFEGQGKLLPKLQEITSFIEEHRDKILVFLLNLPKIAGIALNSVKETFNRLFSTNDNGALVITDIFAKYFVLLVNTIYNLFSALFDSLVELAKTFGPRIGAWLGKGISDSVASMIEGLIELIANSPIGTVIGSVYEFFTGENPYNLFADWQNSVINTFDGITDNLDGWAETSQNWARTSANLASTWTKTAGTIKSDFKGFGGELKNTFGDISDNLASSIMDVLDNTDLPDDLKKALKGAKVSVSVENTSSASTGSDSESSSSSVSSSNLSGILGALGQIGSVIQSIMSSNWIGLIIQFLSALVSALSEASETFNKLINGISTIADIVASIITDFDDFEEILKPFMDGLNSIGGIIGNVLQLFMSLVNYLFTDLFSSFTETLNLVADIIEGFRPLIEIFSKLILLITGIKPLLAGLAQIISTVANVIANVLNFISPVLTGFVNFFIMLNNAITRLFRKISLPVGISIGWGGISVKWKSLATMLNMEIMDHIDGLSFDTDANEYDTDDDDDKDDVKGGSASYTAAKDVYVNIYFSNSFVNGDAQEIAVMLKKEIARAESKNLV